MKNILVNCFFALALNGVVSAQAVKPSQDPVLLTVGGNEITRSEFQAIYNKNNNKETVIDKKSLDEYLQLYINFKLKVKEAEELGLDTAAAFKNELDGYRKQLAQPYLTDNLVNEKLLTEAYERMKEDIKASHILIKVDPNALPKDTIAAYNKIMAARERVMKGENFEAVAKQVSQDPSAKENGGDLGYFTVMQMVYPFETAAYKAKVGEVTQPVRTRFGYHIIKVNDRRKAQGQVQVAHIMVKLAKGATPEEIAAAKTKIDEIYQKLKNGEDFAELAKQHSDDKGSSKKGGELPWFGTGRMVPEFEKVAFGLAKNGDYSEPIQTQYGWHILKRLDKKEIPSFEEAKAELKGKVSKDSRAQQSRTSLIARIKKDYKFKENLKNRDAIVKYIDTTFFEGKWSADKAAKLDKPLFNFNDKVYTQADFAKYLASHQTKRPKVDPAVVVNQMYTQFVDEMAIAYEETQLASKYPEYKALMQEYRDGILLFDLTDKKVWSKAVKDTAGLQEFYEKNKSNFMWGERVEATVYTAKDEEVAKQVRKYLEDKKKKYTSDDILKFVNKESQLNLKVESGKFAKGENEFVDLTKWQPGLSADLKKDNQVTIVSVTKSLPPEVKSLSEAKGLVTAEYQNYLEKEWIEELKKKYPVTVNKEVLSTIK